MPLKYHRNAHGCAPQRACRPRQHRSCRDHAHAQFELSHAYRDGDGTEADEALYVQWLSSAAAHGFHEAEVEYGVHCMETHKYAEALAFFEKAARAGHADGKFREGLLLASDHEGVPQNLRIAVVQLRSAAELGHEEAQYRLGLLLRTRAAKGLAQRPGEAFEWLCECAETIEGSNTEAAAECGASARFEIGKMLLVGEGVAVDEVRAAKLFCALWKEGHPEAGLYWAECLLEGHGVPHDLARGFAVLTECVSAHPSPQGHYKLGVCYEFGLGVKASVRAAIDKYSLAAEHFGEECYFRIGLLHHQHSEVGGAGMALQWYRKAAEKSHQDACINLGFCYEHGEGCEADVDEAMRLYHIAAVLGNARAQYNLGQRYAQQSRQLLDAETAAAAAAVGSEEAPKAGASRRDSTAGSTAAKRGASNNASAAANDSAAAPPSQAARDLAIEWYKKAADSGHKDAQNNLGVLLAREGSDAAELERAVPIFEAAANAGHAEACFNLGNCYHRGHGIAHDSRKALRWFEKAAELGHAEGAFNAGVCVLEMHKSIGAVAGASTEARVNKTAAGYYQLAAEKGHKLAQYNIGVCYLHGTGVALNRTLARDWLRKAEAQGLQVATEMLATIDTKA